MSYLNARAGSSAVLWSIIQAPSCLGLWPSGVQLLAETLLMHGLAERIKASPAGKCLSSEYRIGIFNKHIPKILTKPFGAKKLAADTERQFGASGCRRDNGVMERTIICD